MQYIFAKDKEMKTGLSGEARNGLFQAQRATATRDKSGESQNGPNTNNGPNNSKPRKLAPAF